MRLSANKQLQRTGYGVAGAAHVYHFILHTRRASHGSARPLNCGVRLRNGLAKHKVIRWWRDDW
jgi:hypothetical protein